MTHKFFHANISAMDPIVLYKILQIRTDVFVVEQHCPYPELDGRDLEPDSEQVWVTVDDEIAGTIRILRDSDALRIGRVVVAAKHRGTGVARELFTYALERCANINPASKLVLDAQAPLQDWYGSFGFEPVSEIFMEDGIPHITMEL
ncbi:MAG: GNAT family N-acetyltransferase [Corynebacterium casei]|uniref:GNAT family N-acetyltransferase n=1 Tax=Corynebacterium casei TaxID=160386 RepID=UPI0009CC8B4C|nr:GNAT family N-acetyltransferase [Corynebacterium casei]MDN5741810.1 GNAT family N-acetyltransferase [Corynebacterium casei]MDN5800537.1 GNAT family N-acetyltransferase [Corynebacterium casei]MDN5921987.1 GNAT family N-acetyltransferase [Corynebacterium casei]MDN6246352.1 GNAT family N-acetyltransferase [Corynebacterium casei]MDN6264144.1 GNAT family N-acetyltransferase [Corynebacterium casei]